MNFIKSYKTFELNDETYLRAADRLEALHKNRANALRKFVDDRQGVDINYIDPRPLLAIDNIIYYITDVKNIQEVININRDLGNNIHVELESVNSKVKLIIPNYDIKSNFSNTSIKGWEYNVINVGTPWKYAIFYNKIKNSETEFDFYFLNRNSARIFKEIIENETGEKLLCSINDLYKTS